MTRKKFHVFLKQFHKDQEKLLIAKGWDYTQGSDDRLLNFKEVASLTGMTPLQVWAVYWMKHVFAICTYVKFGKLSSEGIKSRFIDEANYNVLGAALLNEMKPAKRPEQKRKRNNVR